MHFNVMNQANHEIKILMTETHYMVLAKINSPIFPTPNFPTYSTY